MRLVALGGGTSSYSLVCVGTRWASGVHAHAVCTCGAHAVCVRCACGVHAACARGVCMRRVHACLLSKVGAACAIELQSHCAATLHREAREVSQATVAAHTQAEAEAEESSGACLDRHSRAQGAQKFGEPCKKVSLPNP